jgi:hypothetical protein
MTRDDIIRMAWQAYDDPTYGFDQKELDDLERFAALVAAHEREAEREACALVAEDYWFYSGREVFSINIAVREIAEEIRARGGE